MDDLDTPLNKKDITAEVTGRVSFDDLDDDNFEEVPESKPETLNPVVGIMDQMILTSPGMLERYGYPSPNLTVWSDWAKPNLSKAFNEYIPENLTKSIESPLACLIIGLGALVVPFLLVIMYIRDKKGKKDEHPPDNTHERVEPAEAAHTVKSREPELNPEPNKPDPVVAKIEAKMHIPDPIELKGF